MNNILKNIALVTLILLVLSSSTIAQLSINGQVADTKGETLIGVNIFEEGTNNGTTTDLDGNFKLSVTDANAKITFSYTGYLSQTIVVGNQTKWAIALKESTALLDEVVVIGYGSVKKSDLTGAVSSLKDREINNTGVISIDQALAGKAAGVIVTTNSGTPGAGASIRIRGFSSLRGTDPLYIIDGVPMDNTPIESMTSEELEGGQITPLSAFSPKDIASIEILKDASATAIYGSRGANGVVIITTKSGKSGKNIIEADIDIGILEIPALLDVLDANEYTINQSVAFANAGNPNKVPANRLDSARAGVLNTINWQDFVFQPGLSHSYNVSARGGSKELKYSVAAGYLNARGVVLDSDFERFSTRVNLDANVNKKLTLSTRISYSVINSNQQSTSTGPNLFGGVGGLINRALRTAPTVQLNADFGDEDVLFFTPRHLVDANDWNNNISQFVGSLNGQFSFTKNLKLKSTFSYQDRTAYQEFYQNNIFPANSGIGRSGLARIKTTAYAQSTLTNQLLYSFGNKTHKLNAFIAQSVESSVTNGLSISNAGFSNDLLTVFAPQSAQFFDPDRVIFSDTKLLSFFGRANYSLNNKWLFTLTGRYDGSSKFAKNNKFGFFPAAAVAYKLSEESFIQQFDDIASLKLRMSYGISGNQGLAPYQSLSIYNTDQFVFSDGAGGEQLSAVQYLALLPNDNLQWERTGQFNVGVDAALFDHKMNITFDYFRKLTTQLLVIGNKIPAHTGFGSFTQNLGSMVTNGLELSIDGYVINRGAFSWNVSADAAIGKTVIKDMGADLIQAGLAFGIITGGTQRLIIGEEIGAFYGFQRAGISQFDDFEEFQNLSEQERIDLYNSEPTASFTPIGGAIAVRPGEQMYTDLNGDGNINELDKTVIGRVQPDLMLGLSNTFKYGNLELNVAIDGQFGQELANMANLNLLRYNGRQELAITKEAWTPENPSTIHPRLDSGNTGKTVFRFSDRYIENASFLRVRNVTLSYFLPETITAKMGLSLCKVYVAGSNLWLLTDYSGFNPDVTLTGSRTQSLGHDNAGYPQTRSWRIGINIRPK